MESLQSGNYWKTPFYWEPGCTQPPSESRLNFVSISDKDLRSMLADAMSTSMDESDRFNVPRVGIGAAVQEVFDLLPHYFDKTPDSWRVGINAEGAPIGFVLPVIFKEERYWKEGWAQGTILYMGVLQQYRGQAFGLELVHEATRVLLRAKCWRIFCDTGSSNHPMINAFRSAGYIERKQWQRPLA